MYNRDPKEEIIMEMFDKISGIVKNVGDSTNDAIETTRLNSKIKEEKAAIDEIQMKLGEYYYGKYSNGDKLEAEALELCSVIEKHHQEIVQAQVAIDSIKEKKEAASLLNKKVVSKSNENMQSKCTSCGALNRNEAKFCRDCGINVIEIEKPKMVDCPSCGVEVKENYKFCNKCGIKL